MTLCFSAAIDLFVEGVPAGRLYHKPHPGSKGVLCLGNRTHDSGHKLICTAEISRT